MLSGRAMPLASITSQLTDAIAHHGVLVVFVLMAIDAVLPVGGELVMLYAGALASGALAQHATAFGASLHHGLGAYVVLALAGALGYLAGALGGWLIGVRGGRPLARAPRALAAPRAGPRWRAPSAGSTASATAPCSSAA